MKSYSVNGVAKDLSSVQEQSFENFMQEMRETYNSEQCLISSIRINGLELSEKEEEALSELPVSGLKSVEVFTAHPRELAEDTLQNLIQFTQHLILQSEEAAGLIGKDIFGPKLSRLADGVATFSDALGTVKRILHVGRHASVDVLEVDLTSILNDVVQAKETRDLDYLKDLLQTHLPKNLEEWRTTGLPGLIRSRDS